MSPQTNAEWSSVANEESLLIEQFVRESGVLLEIQKMALKADLLRLARERGYELIRLTHDHHPLIEVSLYVGSENEKRTSLRCRSMVCGLLRSAGMKVRMDKVFARYRRSVIRCIVAVDW